MSETPDYYKLVKGYHTTHSMNGSSQTDDDEKRYRAVSIALNILHAHALSGQCHVSHYKDEIGPLADAVQEALKTKE